MMRHNTTYRLFIAVSLAALALAGCQRDSLIPTGTAIRYEVSVADIATRGELVNNNDNGDYSDIALALSSFRVAAYNGTSPVFTTAGLTPANVETVSYAGGSWTMPNTYYWPQKTSLTFFAYANLPAEGSSVAITSAGQTLTHEMVSAVADQKDILLGYYQGRGVNGNTAEIRFWHPLTSVFFKAGDLGGEIVTDITLSGLATSGTVTMDADGIIGTWQDVDDYTAESSQSDDAGLAVNATTGVIGDPFILIPQDLTGNGVALTVTCKSGLTLETTISSGEWKSQRTNWYTLNYGSSTNWALTVTPWDEGVSGAISMSEVEYVFEVSDNELTYNNTTEVGTASFAIRSYYFLTSHGDVESARTAVPFDAEYSVDGKDVNDPSKVWTAFPESGETPTVAGISGLKGTGNAGCTTDTGMPITAPAKTISTADEKYKWASESMKGSPSSPLDLSRMQIGGEGAGTLPQNSANCYIVKHPGYYRIPCVYGNSLKNGSEVNTGYHTEVTGVNVLSSFLNSQGNAIQNAYVLKDLSSAPNVAPVNVKTALLWCDAQESGENLITVDETPSVSGETAYLCFHTAAPANLVQGNAVVVLYSDADSDGIYDDGEGLWSWHIWVTDADLNAQNVGEVGTEGDRYYFMSRTLGYCDGQVTSKYTAAYRKIQIRLRQCSGDAEYGYVYVSQPDVVQSAELGNAVYYQWGRKDPFVGAQGATNVAKPMYGSVTAFSTRNYVTFPYNNPMVELMNTIKYPASFVYNGLGDIYEGMDNNYYNLWLIDNITNNIYGKAVKKTVYDPCPYGYTVPNLQAYAYLGQVHSIPTDTPNGAYDSSIKAMRIKDYSGVYDQNLIIQGLGLRNILNGSAGTLAEVPNGNLYYWSSIPSISGTGYANSMALYTSNPSGLYFVPGCPRGSGFSIRPIRDLQ